MALTNRITIDAGDDPRGRILIDGEIATGVRSATLTLAPNDVPRLELEFLVTDRIAEVDAEVRYIAWAFGEYVSSANPVTVLRDLARRLEAKPKPGVTIVNDPPWDLSPVRDHADGETVVEP